MSPEDVGRWLLAIAKHLRVFVQDSRLAYMYATRRSATDGELLLRLRGLERIQRKRLDALALDTGIARQEVDSTVSRLVTTGLISVYRSTSNEITAITETVFTEAEVLRATADLFAAANPSAAECAMLPLIDLLSRLPITETEAMERVCTQGFGEADVRSALELQVAFGLIRKQPVSDFGITLLHNEYLWGHKIGQVGSILAKLGTKETGALLALIEEVRNAQGCPLSKLTSAPPTIVALAADKGIIDTTTVITASGDKQTFAFSPHFYGYRAGPQSAIIDDYSDQVKLFVASITYGVHHSIDFRLHSPLAFVKKLLREGEAGDATPVLRDYILLEKHGIVSVEERSQGRGTFILRKRDIVEKAIDVMVNGSLLSDSYGGNDCRTLVTQNRFRSPETNRLTAGFGKDAGNTARFDQQLFAAVREAAQGSSW